MDNLSLIVALISAGAALITGVISLMIGFDRDGEKVDRIFGIQALCFFTFLILPPTGFIINDKPPYPLEIEIKRIFIWAHYMLMPFFFESFTGVRKKFFTPVIIMLSIAAYGLMLAATAGMIVSLWKIVTYVPLILIALYGYLLVREQRHGGSRKDAQWMGAAIAIYAISLVISLLDTFAQQQLVDLLGPYSMWSLHLNVLAFIVIMSLRIRSKSFRQYKLGKELQYRNRRWEALVYHVQVLIVEMDLSGKILYMNPFGIRSLGCRNPEVVIGKNFFSTFIFPSDVERVKAQFEQLKISGDYSAPENIRLLNCEGHERLVKWSGVITRDPEDAITSIMFFGLDTTDIERSFRQVQSLRDELEKENLLLKKGITVSGDHEIVGESAAIVYAIQKARQVAVTHAAVLLEGETGVGKELFANLIHRESSRSQKPFIKVNCAALPAELIESELFGHEKGAFTGALQIRKGRFELADGGTIFLDEVGDLPMALQPKLLRVLQSGEFERIGGQKTLKVDVRVISATNHHLHQAIKEGLFREDLFYRLSVFPITIPALRNRREDIPLLLTHFLRKFARELNSPVESISKADMNRLIEYDWPGNIRELVNLVERSIISSPGTSLKVDWQNVDALHEADHLLSSIHELEHRHIVKVLRECHWRINGTGGAAERLGLNPNTLRSRMKKMGIHREQY